MGDYILTREVSCWMVILFGFINDRRRKTLHHFLGQFVFSCGTRTSRATSCAYTIFGLFCNQMGDYKHIIFKQGSVALGGNLVWIMTDGKNICGFICLIVFMWLIIQRLKKDMYQVSGCFSLYIISLMFTTKRRNSFCT